MFKNIKYFSIAAWIFLLYNFYVVLGGAYVRATSSGAGCGAHWPLCKGEVIPQFSVLHTIIEFTHRASSGIVLVGGIILFIWSFYCTEKSNPIRKSAGLVLVFILIEALLGAALVLLKLVDKDASLNRAAMMPFHLIATFMLLGFLTLTAVWASQIQVRKIVWFKKNLFSCYSLLGGILVVGATGAVTALGDTLFKPNYVGEGIVSDIQFKSHILKSVRIFHPIIAIIISFYCIFTCLKLTNEYSSPNQRFLCKTILTILVVQMGMGFANILLLAPIWLQILHLFMADFLWVLVILFLNEYLSSPEVYP